MANKPRPIGVQIEHVGTVLLDMNGNAVDPSIASKLPTATGKPIIASEQIIIRVMHVNELVFYAKPGMGKQMAQVAVSDPAFWSVALKALVSSGRRDNFDKASMGAAYQAVLNQAEKVSKCGRIEKP